MIHKQIVPIPKEISYTGNQMFNMPYKVSYQVDDQCDELQRWLRIWLPSYTCEEVSDVTGNIVCIKQPRYISQGYKVEVTEHQIYIEYGDIKGLYYGVVTLGKLIRLYQGQIPVMCIEDYPDMRQRVLLFKMGEYRIPTLKSLYDIVDVIAPLFYNKLQIDGLDPAVAVLISDEELTALRGYCQDRCIELVIGADKAEYLGNREVSVDKYIILGRDGFSFSGKYEVMVRSIDQEVKDYMGYGDTIFVVDLANDGDIRPLYVRYLVYIYAGSKLWNATTQEVVKLDYYMSELVWKDTSGQIGKVIVKMAQYSQYEGSELAIGTLTYQAVMKGYLCDKIQRHEEEIAQGKAIEQGFTQGVYDYTGFNQMLRQTEVMIKQIAIASDDVIKWELINTYYWIKLGVRMHHYIQYEYQLDVRQREKKVLEILEIIHLVKGQWEFIWLDRYQPKGLEIVLNHLVRLERIYTDKREQLKASVFVRKLQYIQHYTRYLIQLGHDYKDKQMRYKKIYRQYTRGRSFK
ncbi:MAG: glycoside hydrolase family 20 zincin-like fold domain-containing protein [Cellulosilyticaceae bacterium]